MQPVQDLTALTDKSLLQSITEGNKQALIVLFDRYAADLYSYVLPQVRARTLKELKAEDVARNILIDIFTSFWDDRNKLSIATTVRAYLFAGALTRTIDYLRHRKDYDLQPSGSQDVRPIQKTIK